MYEPDDDHRAGRELDEIVGDLRRLPGFADVGTGPVYERVAGTTGADPVVYLAAARHGGLALIVRGGAVEHVPLQCLGADTLGRAVRDHLRGYEAFRAVAGTPAEQTAWQDWAARLDHTTGWLWDAAMGPVVDRLAGTDAVHVVPCGLLGLLPLHAAWTADHAAPTGRRHLVDHLAVSYLPNAQALRACRSTAAGAGTGRLLAVADPEEGDRSLPGTRVEAAAAAAGFPMSRVISGAAATRGEVACLETSRAILLNAGWATGTPDLQDR